MNADEEKQKKAISLDEDLVIKLSILAVRKNKTKSEVIREALSKSNMPAPLETVLLTLYFVVIFIFVIKVLL
ncbi:hypothetical protein CBK19_22925 [Salmonella enterica subsp. enterica serovar Hillingdon]|uniref:ribbon-helix-helix protein, CopG family n=1 Tax=Salmonella enterica TaxID=28901 RepID=UPI0009B17C07|nr:ribbon-helix-helix protein, CopG family [Salmonella enterica]EBW2268517.1 hypothetical protein [Salmonella enterica subsp. enterica serovar Hillingdon]ECB6312611.1 hypothetical protein [Salmonella enterica subsp. enterica serovar Chailey]EDR0865640.1 hypothetical protein [Salmonella enterica subsp. enterica serovar Hillingdon]EDR6326932.1 hypothetical protein [Salmonella enterica subsp. enterica serovar Hillingdon]